MVFFQPATRWVKLKKIIFARHLIWDSIHQGCSLLLLIMMSAHHIKLAKALCLILLWLKVFRLTVLFAEHWFHLLSFYIQCVWVTASQIKNKQASVEFIFVTFKKLFIKNLCLFMDYGYWCVTHGVWIQSITSFYKLLFLYKQKLFWGIKTN